MAFLLALSSVPALFALFIAIWWLDGVVRDLRRGGDAGPDRSRGMRP